MHPDDPNIAMLEAVVECLGPLVEDMVFVGGAITGLLITDEAAPGVRATDDVDALVEVTSRVAYHRVAERLRARGFAEDDSFEPMIARWRRGSLVLDVMPTDEEILGFGNPWYARAFQSAEPASLPSGHRIWRLSAPLFLATKLAAFDGRGRGDYQASHDMEDLIAVVDGRARIVDEVAATEPGLARHLANRFVRLLDDPDFDEALPGLLPPDPASQQRRTTVRARLEAIAADNRS